MKIYIMTDMEGVSGIRLGGVGFCNQSDPPGNTNYAVGQRLLTADVNAAVEGALAGGATRVVVCDGHGGGKHILVEALHPEAELESPVSGRRNHYMPSFDKSFAALFVVGAHAMAGTPRAFLDHTQSGKDWYNYYLNGKKTGEIGQYAAMAGHFDVPVAFVSGDLAATVEARNLLGAQVETVSVKTAVSRNVARVIAPVKAQAMIREGACRAMKKIGKLKPLKLKTPVNIKLEFQRTELADQYEHKPGIRRLDGRAIACKVESQFDILNF
jgi:D-amino peptidase